MLRKHPMTKASWCIGLILLLAQAASASRMFQPFRHQRFFLRLNGPGFGGQFAFFSGPGTSATLAGFAVTGEFSIGACPVRNLALHLNVGMVGAPSMTSLQQTDPVGSMHDAAGSHLGGMFVMHVGGGATYYFGRSHVFATLTAGAGFLLGPPRECGEIVCIRVASLEAEGFCVRGSIGKEYWVSDYWAIGFAGNIQYHHLGNNDIGVTWDILVLALSFSATYN